MDSDQITTFLSADLTEILPHQEHFYINIVPATSKPIYPPNDILITSILKLGMLAFCLYGFWSRLVPRILCLSPIQTLGEKDVCCSLFVV